MSRQYLQWDKIFENYITDRLLLTTKSSYEVTKDMNKQSLKDEIQIANIYMKKCLRELAIREMQIKYNEVSHHSVRIAFIQKSKIKKCCRECGGNYPNLVLVWMWTSITIR